MENTHAYSMEDLVPVMLEFFEEDKKVIILATGNSMAPLIRHKKDSVVLEGYKGGALEFGDMIFYKRKDGTYVLHRIIDISPDGKYTTLGDNQTNLKEVVSKEQIFALPVAVIRGKKEISLNSKRYRIYTKFWGKKSVFRWIHIRCFKFRIELSRFLKKFI